MMIIVFTIAVAVYIIAWAVLIAYSTPKDEADRIYREYEEWKRRRKNDYESQHRPHKD